MAENVNLDDLMGKPSNRSTTVFDMTAGKGAIQQPTVENEQQANRPAMKAVPVSSGPIDMSTVRPVDINTILPKREPKQNAMEASMLADLDAAIDRECANITEFHQQLFAKQEEERLAVEEAEEEKKLAAQDDFALHGIISNNDDSDDASGLYDDKDEFDMTNMHDTSDTAVRPMRFNLMDDDEGTSYTTTGSVPYCDPSDPGLTINQNTVSFAAEKDAEVSTNNNKPVIATEKNEPSILDNVKDDDLFDDEEESSIPVEPEPSAEDLLNDLKEQVKERIAPKRSKLDFSKFTIAQKAISAQKVMKLAISAHQNRCCSRTASLLG